MQIQFCQVVRDQEKGLLTTLRAFAISRRDVGVHVTPGLFQRFRQHRHILVGAFDVVKGRFGFFIHRHAFPTSLSSAGGLVGIQMHPILAQIRIGCESEPELLYSGYWGGKEHAAGGDRRR